MKTKFLYITCLVALTGSCQLYKTYERPQVEANGLYRDPYFPADTLTSDTTNMANFPWQTIFQDVELQRLIRQGLQNNTDLQIARLRIEEAQAALLSSRLSFAPSLNLTPEGTISSFDHSKAIKTYQLPLVTSWEVDVFGRLLNASRGSYASLLQSEAYRQAVQTEVIANIANLYFTLLMLDEQMDITEETAALWKENIRALEAMKEAGMTNEAAVVQSKANSYQVEASIYDLQQQIRETENALSILLGQAPTQIPRTNLKDQELPDHLAAGISVQLLSNRPDVRYAEMQLAVAYYATNRARAAFYPQLTISGTAGWTNSAGTAVSNPGKLILSAVGSLTQPIFNRGANIANLRIAKAQQEEAALTFQQSLLNAGQEVSDALFQYDASINRSVERRAQIDALEKAVYYTRELFGSGASTYLEILTAQQSLLSAQLNEVSDQFDKMQAVVNLYKALGGGVTCGETKN